MSVFSLVGGVDAGLHMILMVLFVFFSFVLFFFFCWWPFGKYLRR